MRTLLLVFFTIGMATTALAVEAIDVPNSGRFEFDHLPNMARPVWNLDNLDYPADAITIEPIDGRNNGLRVGQADGTQSGRYTITLRASTHDWNPVQLGVSHSVTVRMFTQAENADQHCQMGNLNLACQVLTHWLQQPHRADAA